jgi:prepilin-type N-terminal cleavage/methylation domain-containing protein
MTKRNRKGFTLVEMMIVVLIIGILIAIALPNFMRARENARLRACVSNMKQIQAAIEQWAMENKKAANDAVPTLGDLSPTYIKTWPTCPSGGSYTISGTVGNYSISCSIHGDLYTLINSL